MKQTTTFLLALGSVVSAAAAQESRPARIDGYHEFNYGQVAEDAEQWTQAIRVSEPALGSEVRGDVTVKFQAVGMKYATAFCWRQTEALERWGEDANLTPDGIRLDAEGNGTFVFPAERFPHGPVNVRIYAHNGKDRKDIFELQLFNRGGASGIKGSPRRTRRRPGECD